jgi:hypothetical protein
MGLPAVNFDPHLQLRAGHRLENLSGFCKLNKLRGKPGSQFDRQDFSPFQSSSDFKLDASEACVAAVSSLLPAFRLDTPCGGTTRGMLDCLDGVLPSLPVLQSGIETPLRNRNRNVCLLAQILPYMSCSWKVFRTFEGCCYRG